MSNRFLRPLLSLAFLAMLAGGFATMTGCSQKTPEEKLQNAQQLLQENQIPLAVLKIKEIIEENPESPVIPEARMTLAAIYLRLGSEENLQNAVDQLETLISNQGWENPRALQAHEALVQMFMRLDRMEDALAQAQEGVENTEGDPELHAQMKLLQTTLKLVSGDEELEQEGMEWLKERMLASEENSERGQARELLAQHLRQTDQYEEVIAVYDEYMEAYPDDSVNALLMMTKAIDLKRLGQEERAEEVFQEGVERRNAQIEEELDLAEKARLKKEMAMLQASYGNIDEAEELLREIMAERPMSQAALDAQFTIARVNLSANRIEKAEEIFRQIASENPNTNISQTAEQYLQGIQQMRARAEQAASQDQSATGTLDLELDHPLPRHEKPEPEPLNPEGIEPEENEPSE